MITKEDKKIVKIVEQSVSEYFNLENDDLVKKTKKTNIVIPRQLAHKLTRDLTGLSLKDIGFLIGRKDHSTVLNSLVKTKNLIQSNRRYNYMYREIEGICKSKLGIEDNYDVEKHINDFRRTIRNPELVSNFNEIINRLIYERDRRLPETEIIN